jgi:phage recombination protein Bet
MSTTPAPQTQAPSTATKSPKSEFEILLEKDTKSLSWIAPYGADEGYTIPLSVKLVRDYVAVPAWDKESQQQIDPPDNEIFKFIALCKARRLNPYEGDAYMIPFWDGSSRKHRWSLITSHNAYLKRAELHPKYDGMDSGIIVLNNGQLIEREGDFEWPGDQLMGGWATVYHKDHSHPKKAKVKLSTYKKPFGVWNSDGAGMICKVAEAHAIRDTFATLVAGMYLREEMEGDTPVPEVKKPSFEHNFAEHLSELSRKAAIEKAPEAETGDKPKRNKRTLVEEPLDPPAPEPPKPVEPPTPPTAAPVTEQAPSALEPPEAELLRLCKDNGIPVFQFVKFLTSEKWMKPPQTKLTELSTAKLTKLIEGWHNEPASFVERIKKA